MPFIISVTPPADYNKFSSLLFLSCSLLVYSHLMVKAIVECLFKCDSSIWSNWLFISPQQVSMMGQFLFFKIVYDCCSSIVLVKIRSCRMLFFLNILSCQKFIRTLCQLIEINIYATSKNDFYFLFLLFYFWMHAVEFVSFFSLTCARLLIGLQAPNNLTEYFSMCA